MRLVFCVCSIFLLGVVDAGTLRGQESKGNDNDKDGFARRLGESRMGGMANNGMASVNGGAAIDRTTTGSAANAIKKGMMTSLKGIDIALDRVIEGGNTMVSVSSTYDRNYRGEADVGTITITKHDGSSAIVGTTYSDVVSSGQITSGGQGGSAGPGGAGGAFLGPITITSNSGSPPAPQPQPQTPMPTPAPPTSKAPTPDPTPQPTPPPTPNPTPQPTPPPVPGATPQPTPEPTPEPTPPPTPEPSPPPTPPPTNPPPPPTNPPTPSPTPEPQLRDSCPQEVYTDVVIVGAGMAGIKAAATLQSTDPNLDYIILESTDRVGGRVRSTTFGVEGNRWTIEDAANWILFFKNNPIWDLMEATELKAANSDYSNYVVYDENGNPVDTALYESKVSSFMDAWTEAEAEADNQWDKNYNSYQDLGLRNLLARHGWSVPNDASGNLDFMVEYGMIDWEYAARDTSVRFFPYYFLEEFHLIDQRGYEIIPQQYFQYNVDPTALKTSTRATKISYHEAIQQNGKTYQATVTANSPGGCTTQFIAQRVISTVSVGVINSDLISFDPPLRYAHQLYNPYEFVHYVKIFYQFRTKFWDDAELILIARDVQHRGHCHLWHTMDQPNYMPGSNIIRCEMMTEAFNALIDPVTKELSESTLLSLLDPLRTAYGFEVVGTPLEMYYPKLNKEADFGYGSYANWKIGKTFDDFAHFFGGTPMVKYCEHNGCSLSGQWILHLSGSATCYGHSEFVHGAYFAGERSANFVLESLGYDVKTDKSPCDVDWKWLTRRRRL